MEITNWTKQIISYQKTAFDNWYNAVVLMQDQAEKAINVMVDQNSRLPETGQKFFKQWQDILTKGQQTIKTSVNESFDTIESLLDESSLDPASKTKKAPPKQS